jgi:flagellar motility protein MotE (MotC chaperone)
MGMPKLTSDQAFDLAQSFHDLSVEIGNFRFRVHQDLTPAKRRQLEDLQFDVLNISTQFNALSISLALDNLQEALDDISAATEKMKKAIKRLKDVQKVVAIATAAVTLGSAIISMNPGAIASALGGVVTAVKPSN